MRMARYYFDLLDGTTQRDQVGAEMINDGAAKQEALLRALNGHSHQIAHYYGSEEIAVRNEAGEQIFKTPIMRKKPTRALQ
jgi:hypothetical protein